MCNSFSLCFLRLSRVLYLILHSFIHVVLIFCIHIHHLSESMYPVHEFNIFLVCFFLCSTALLLNLYVHPGRDPPVSLDTDTLIYTIANTSPTQTNQTSGTTLIIHEHASAYISKIIRCQHVSPISRVSLMPSVVLCLLTC